MNARRRWEKPPDNPLVPVAGHLWGPAIRDLAGLTIREAAKRLRRARVVVHSPTLDLIVHGRQESARLDLVRGVAQLCGIPDAWLRTDGAGNGEWEETVGIRLRPAALPEWETIGLVRSSFLLACMRAARRDHVTSGGSQKAWLPLRQRLKGAFLHLVDPDHWGYRLTTGKAARLALGTYAAECAEWRRRWLAILGPWLRDEEALDYGFLWEVTRARRARKVAPRRFARGLWMELSHRTP